MLNYSKLMTLAEASTGFVGGSIVDEFPGMSLSECAGRLPVVCLESQIELTQMVSEQNEAIVEATINAIQYGNSAEADSLVEGAFESIINHIKSFFAKIKKFVKSVIDKLGVQINKIRMTGKQLLARYKNSEMLNHSFDDLVVNGYKFEHGDAFNSVDAYTASPRDLLKKGVPDAMSPEDFGNLAKGANKAGYDKNSESVSMKQLDDNMEKMTDTSSEERKLAFAEAMINGVDMSSDNWLADLKNALYGDKVDLTFGTDFTLDSVKKDLAGEDLDKIRSAYQKLITALNNDENTLTKTASTFSKENKSTEAGKDVPKVISLANKYYSAYLTMYSDCTAVITSIQNVRIGYEQAKVKQAKSIFAKMLTYKKKSDNADASDMEGIDELDVIM